MALKSHLITLVNPRDAETTERGLAMYQSTAEGLDFCRALWTTHFSGKEVEGQWPVENSQQLSWGTEPKLWRHPDLCRELTRDSVGTDCHVQEEPHQVIK